MVKIVRGNACRKQITEDPCLKVTYEGHEFYVATKEELSPTIASARAGPKKKARYPHMREKSNADQTRIGADNLRFPA
jgi:hypothetical protein